MPMFDYRCADCGLTFEVARPEARADAEAFCPICGQPIVRVRNSLFRRISRHFADAHAFARHAHGDGPGQHRHF